MNNVKELKDEELSKVTGGEDGNIVFGPYSIKENGVYNCNGVVYFVLNDLSDGNVNVLYKLYVDGNLVGGGTVSISELIANIAPFEYLGTTTAQAFQNAKHVNQLNLVL